VVVHFLHVSREVTEDLTEGVALEEAQCCPCDAAKEALMNANAGTEAELEEEKGSMQGEVQQCAEDN
jgi:hypothetical protein